MKSSVLPWASNWFQLSMAFSIAIVIEPPFLGVPLFMLFRPTVEVVTPPPDLLLEQAVATSATAHTAVTPATSRRFLDPDMESSNPLARARRPARDRLACLSSNTALRPSQRGVMLLVLALGPPLWLGGGSAGRRPEV